ncbi:MAG: SH3 domain-containing protein [Cyanobacteria bacterium J06638_28]
MKKVRWLILGASLLSLGIFPALALAEYPSGIWRTFCVAELEAENSDARINLRAGPSTTYEIVSYGTPGDFVHLVTQNPPEPNIAEDSEGFLWYRVGFPKSKAVGWIRADFLQRYCLADNPD